MPVAVAGTDEAMGRGTGRIGRYPITVEICEPIHPADFEDHLDPLGEMTEAWRRRIDAVLRSHYEG